MKIKDIEKEGYISFLEEDKEKEVGQEEYDQLIEKCYIDRLKYGGKIDSVLKEKYDNLKYRTKKVKGISTIYVFVNANLDRRAFVNKYDNFIAAEDGEGKLSLLYDINTGEDLSFDFNKKVAFYQDISEMIYLYEFNKKDFQEEFNIGYMETIFYIKNAKLLNSNNKELVSESDYIEFKDRLGNIFYLDVLNNRVYTRLNNYELVKSKDTTEHLLFERNKWYSFDKDVFQLVKKKR